MFDVEQMICIVDETGSVLWFTGSEIKAQEKICRKNKSIPARNKGFPMVIEHIYPKILYAKSATNTSPCSEMKSPNCNVKSEKTNFPIKLSKNL